MRDVRSKEAQRWRRWYKTVKWRRYRRDQLDAQPLCQCPHCTSGKTVRLQASVVDHKTPHNGSRALFFDRDNLQSYNKECHDRWKQSQETGGHGFFKGCDATGQPLNADHHWNNPAQ